MGEVWDSPKATPFSLLDFTCGEWTHKRGHVGPSVESLAVIAHSKKKLVKTIKAYGQWLVSQPPRVADKMKLFRDLRYARCRLLKQWDYDTYVKLINIHYWVPFNRTIDIEEWKLVRDTYSKKVMVAAIQNSQTTRRRRRWLGRSVSPRQLVWIIEADNHIDFVEACCKYIRRDKLIKLVLEKVPSVALRRWLRYANKSRNIGMVHALLDDNKMDLSDEMGWCDVSVIHEVYTRNNEINLWHAIGQTAMWKLVNGHWDPYKARVFLWFLQRHRQDREVNPHLMVKYMRCKSHAQGLILVARFEIQNRLSPYIMRKGSPSMEIIMDCLGFDKACVQDYYDSHKNHVIAKRKTSKEKMS